MPSILTEFAYGNISPNEHPFSKNTEFGRVVALAERLEDKLLEKLNPEEKEMLQQLLDAQSEVSRFVAVKDFLYGYKLGLTMTAEAFVTSGELIV